MKHRDFIRLKDSIAWLIKIVKLAPVLILFLQLTYAMPLPRGIDGMIFYNDNSTEMPVGTNFTICALEHCINGSTGYYTHSGRYSVALNGDDGTEILIKVWSQNISANRTVILNGSMHGVNLFLNIIPPNKLLGTNSSNSTESPTHINGTPMNSTNSTSENETLNSQLHHSNEGSSSEVSINSSINAFGFANLPRDKLHSYSINPLPNPDKEYIDVYGSLFNEQGKQLNKDTIIIIKNIRTGEEVKSTTGVISNGSFYVPIKGKPGDTIKVIVNHNEFNITKNSTEYFNNFEVKTIQKNLLELTIILIFIIVLLSSIFLFRWLKK
jgi:hypothetical protein